MVSLRVDGLGAPSTVDYESKVRNMMLVVVVLCLVGMALAQNTDIQTLANDNFEHLTQASTGATTGDWFIKFYAPWCGHCKKMQPAWEETAARLAGEVNVAEIDVTTARNIGTRFDVKGFPTILFLRAGKVYKYKGRRVADDLVAFAQGGYADSSIEPTVVPEPMGMMGPFFKVITDFLDLAKKALRNGDYFSPIMLAVYLFLFFLLIFVVVLVSPQEDVRRPRMAAAKDVDGADKTE